MTKQERCEVCQEPVSLREIEMGQVAEMHDPNEPTTGGVVHGECGIGKGWVVS